MMYIIYDKNTYKITSRLIANEESDLVINDNEAILKNDKITDHSASDIRAYNGDGSIKSLEQQLEEGLIEIEKDEIIKDNLIYKLNKNLEEDRIILVEKGLEELKPEEKIVEENGVKKITQKSEKEQFDEGLISEKDYNEYIIRERSSEYSSKLDNSRLELIDSVLLSLKEKGLLTEEQIKVLEDLVNTRAEIKEKYPKVKISKKVVNNG